MVSFVLQDGFENELLRISAYGTLAQFWLNLGTKEDMYEDEAKSFLLLQQSLIDRFEKTLRACLDDESVKEFLDYVDKFKVRIIFKQDEKPTPYLHKPKSSSQRR